MKKHRENFIFEEYLSNLEFQSVISARRSGQNKKYSATFLGRNECENTLESFLNRLHAISALAEMKIWRHVFWKNGGKTLFLQFLYYCYQHWGGRNVAETVLKVATGLFGQSELAEMINGPNIF